MSKVLAHKCQISGSEQLLDTHLLNVANLMKDFGKDIEQANILFLIGLLHDIGKADPLFQKKIQENPKLKVKHSQAGAKFLIAYITMIKEKLAYENDVILLFCKIVGYVISAHHGVYDIYNEKYNDNQLFKKFKYDQIEAKYDFKTVEKYTLELLTKESINLDQLINKAIEEFIRLKNKFNSNDKDYIEFNNGLIMRLYLSILKKFDIYDTINAYEISLPQITDNELNNLKEKFVNKIEKKYAEFPAPENEINRLRSSFSEQALVRGKSDESGIYRLDLPTGAGKTLISLRYGMHQLKEMNKSRFIYVTPFLSVLEQNAKEIKDILQDKYIIEHHSNFHEDENNDDDTLDSQIRNYLVESWDSPIIITTMVQFFRTLFKSSSNNLRRFSSLKNSVIILDEVQSLPVEVTYIFNLCINFLHKAMNATIILCTATQPLYDLKELKYPLKVSKHPQLIKMNNLERDIFNRTEVFLLNEGNPVNEYDILHEVELYPDDSFLIVMNTKKAVEKIANILKNRTDRKIYILSTNFCAKHRQDIINKIKNIIEKEPIICVSTQLIEAGVDLDFNRLIRSYTGIDSIVQSSGRCNRHGKMESKGIVKLAKTQESLENTKVKALQVIQDKIEITEYILRNLQNEIDINSLNNKFYEKYYINHEHKMKYPIKNESTAFDLLASNKLYNLRQLPFSQSFKLAATKIELIQNNTKSLIVYYGESFRLIDKLIENLNTFEDNYDLDLLSEIKDLLSNLQKYTVNVYNLYDFEQFLIYKSNEKIKNIIGEIYILNQENYDLDYGINNEITNLII
ncbi:CRISPR-associated helicase Cas3' [Macrococcus capreoli]